MRVNGITVCAAAVIGLAVGAFATGQVGGVVLPLLFVLACPLMMMFVIASMRGPDGPAARTAARRQEDDAPVPSGDVRR